MFDFELGIFYFLFFFIRYLDFIFNRFRGCLSPNFSFGEIIFSRRLLGDIQKPEIQRSWCGDVSTTNGT